MLLKLTDYDGFCRNALHSRIPSAIGNPITPLNRNRLACWHETGIIFYIRTGFRKVKKFRFRSVLEFPNHLGRLRRGRRVTGLRQADGRSDEETPPTPDPFRMMMGVCFFVGAHGGAPMIVAMSMKRAHAVRPYGKYDDIQPGHPPSTFHTHCGLRLCAGRNVLPDNLRMAEGMYVR
jgi:hypothetical protein